MGNAQVIELAHRSQVNVYRCLPVAFVRGQGPYLYDADGNRYLDFFSGLAVTGLGQGHPRLVEAICEQAKRLLHVSNVFHTEPAARLAERLSVLFGDGKVFLSNSGAEANEAAIKLARLWGHRAGGGRFEIVTAANSFHGRTLATLAATGQEQYRRGFEPAMPGFRVVPFNDLPALAAAVGPQTVAVMLEPIQGEGGVVAPHPDYLQEVRVLCDRQALLLILDEIQTGMGRTGKMFAYQHSAINPDIVTLAKSLAGGLPIGATIAHSRIAAVFEPGSHGSTFGGNPVACAAALAVLDVLNEEGLVDNAARLGEYMLERLRQIARQCPAVVEVRGKGLLIGIALDRPARPVVEHCLKERLVTNATAETVLRLLPPLIVEREEADLALNIIERALRGLN
jgi:predicted acetylornithine/succinylornithine family transaminase